MVLEALVILLQTSISVEEISIASMLSIAVGGLWYWIHKKEKQHKEDMSLKDKEIKRLTDMMVERNDELTKVLTRLIDNNRK